MASERPERLGHTEFNAAFTWIKSKGRLGKEYDADGSYTVIAEAAGCSRQKKIVPPELPGAYERALVEIVRDLRAVLGPLGK